MKTKTSLKSLALILVAAFTLSACSGTKESPEVVIQKFKEAVKEIQSVDASLQVNMKGTDDQDEIDFSFFADAKIDRRDSSMNKAEVNLRMDGNLSAGGKTIDGKLTVAVITLGEDFFFNLSKLETTDPSAQSFLPLVQPYMGKWLHLASDFVPQNIRDLQSEDEEAMMKEEELKNLFVNSNLFEVNKQFGVESLNGKKVYHYGIKLNEQALKDYIRESATIDGSEMTDEEVEEAASIAKSVTNVEMWIGVKDYYLYKGVASISGEDLDQGVESQITATYTAKSYNSKLKISAPTDAEEFNPLAIMMGGLELPPLDVLGGSLDGLEGLNLEGLELPQ